MKKTFLAHEYTISKKAKYSRIDRVTSADSVVDFFRSIYKGTENVNEKVYALFLDNNNRIAGFYLAGQGNKKASVIDVQGIYLTCIKSMASAVILVHNHPSGNLKYSNEDLKITNKVKEGLTLLDCKLLDHVILTETEFFSFNQNNLL